MAKLTKPQNTLLTAVVAATTNQEVEENLRFVYVTVKNNKPLSKLLDLKLVVINDTIQNEDGQIACRAEASGIELVQIPVEPVEPVEEIQPELPVEPVEPVVEVNLEAPEVASNVVEAPPAPPVVSGEFAIEKGVPMPKVRRNTRNSRYPFDVMEIDDSFHVPTTEDDTDPAKRLASTVSARNKSYQVDGELTRKFVVRRVGAEDSKGEGARVFRVDLPVVELS